MLCFRKEGIYAGHNIRPPTRMEIERQPRHRHLYHLRRAAADSGGALPNLVPRPERAEIVASFSPAVLWYLPPSPLSPAVSFYTTVATIRSFRAFPNAAFYASPILLRVDGGKSERGIRNKNRPPLSRLDTPPISNLQSFASFYFQNTHTYACT